MRGGWGRGLCLLWYQRRAAHCKGCGHRRRQLSPACMLCPAAHQAMGDWQTYNTDIVSASSTLSLSPHCACHSRSPVQHALPGSADLASTHSFIAVTSFTLQTSAGASQRRRTAKNHDCMDALHTTHCWPHARTCKLAGWLTYVGVQLMQAAQGTVWSGERRPGAVGRRQQQSVHQSQKLPSAVHGVRDSEAGGVQARPTRRRRPGPLEGSATGHGQGLRECKHRF